MNKSLLRKISILVFVAGAIAMTGCSTVAGVGSLIGGMGRDINDAAEGARTRMSEKGVHRMN